MSTDMHVYTHTHTHTHTVMLPGKLGLNASAVKCVPQCENHAGGWGGGGGGGGGVGGA